MKITFVSNYLTIHQIPFCEVMYRELGENFRFVNTAPMTAERVSMGWSNENRYPFEIDMQQAGSLIDESDIVIIGSANDTLIHSRLKHNQPVIRYSERILKEGRWHILSPRAIRNVIKEHTRFTNQKIWMLCASAYAAGDYGLFGAYWEKCYKWGYFPKTIHCSEEQIFEKKKNTAVHLLWCGRMLGWKHPELAVMAANHLREKGIPFRMDIIGEGESKTELQRQLAEHHLVDAVVMHGFLAPDQVRSYMDNADIFLFTSDFHEGWGAVLNEAMNSGCACVASHAIGAAPYLIRDGENGFLYRNGDTGQFCRRVEQLARDPSLCRTMGLKAYRTIADTWNADTAAQRLLHFCEAILRQEAIPYYQEGPLSKAGFLSNHWYKGKG